MVFTENEVQIVGENIVSDSEVRVTIAKSHRLVQRRELVNSNERKDEFSKLWVEKTFRSAYGAYWRHYDFIKAFQLFAPNIDEMVASFRTAFNNGKMSLG